MKPPPSLILIFLLALFVAVINLGGCSYRNVDLIKANAAQKFDSLGFEIVGYDGYNIGTWDAPGGKVWYILQRKGDPSVRYAGCLTKWREEYQLCYLRAIDAIRP